MKTFDDYIQEILEFYRQNGVQVDPVPEVRVDNSPKNILDPFVPTGNYNPATSVITVHINNRQLKDILRTFCHELIHHNQKLSDPDGFMMVNKAGTLQENDQLAQIEQDAYSRGNIMFRKWTETHRN